MTLLYSCLCQVLVLFLSAICGGNRAFQVATPRDTDCPVSILTAEVPPRGTRSPKARFPTYRVSHLQVCTPVDTKGTVASLSIKLLGSSG
ncbi:hypothetical protein PGTUg99_006161 [Puccinia graminis f. sp. tritici]|uniref:Secreted protein n=1 Tax=Puccinia graminis f. sp. tritici TaxID=56615 RepID=A0A5B0SBX2_PUCGR|nr:hypothetical protein PGTUg99_006161 [Puccinia graminis f. sp. tritici]